MWIRHLLFIFVLVLQGLIAAEGRTTLLVYEGPGVSEECLAHTLYTLKFHL